MSIAPERRGISRTAFIIGTVCLLAVFALLVVAVKRSDRPDREALPSALIGKPTPATVLPMLHDLDKTFDLASLSGKPYLLNVWGSWCPECRTEHPVITALAKTGQVRLVGYNLKDNPTEALRWLQQFGNPYEFIISDIDGSTAIQWGIYGAPETFLIDTQGIIRWKHVGALNEAIIQNELIPALIAAGRTP